MMGTRLTFQTRTRAEQHQELRPDVAAIGENMAHMLGVQREIRGLIGRRSFADAVWARALRGGR